MEAWLRGQRRQHQDGARCGRRCQAQGLTAREAVGLFFATQTGNTETAAGVIAEKAGVEAMDVGDISADDFASYDGLIVGCPTWNTVRMSTAQAPRGTTCWTRSR